MYGCQLQLASGSTVVSHERNKELMSVCRVNRRSGECQGEVSSLDLDVTGVMFSQKVSKGPGKPALL